MTARDKDVRLKLTGPSHKALVEIASSNGKTIQAYVEEMLLSHIQHQVAVAKRIVEAVNRGADAVSTSGLPQLLYFIQKGGVSGPVKIGVSSGISRRLKNLQNGSEEPLSLLLSVPQTERTNERSVHRMFRAQRMDGEWFRCSTELLSFIDSLKQEE